MSDDPYRHATCYQMVNDLRRWGTIDPCDSYSLSEREMDELSLAMKRIAYANPAPLDDMTAMIREFSDRTCGACGGFGYFDQLGRDCLHCGGSGEGTHPVLVTSDAHLNHEDDAGYMEALVAHTEATR